MTASLMLLVCLPFLLSLIGKAQMPRFLCFIASALALMLSVQPWSAVLPWTLGMAIAVISVSERASSLWTRTTR
jgi:Na+/H+-dicarboxylate symporter